MSDLINAFQVAGKAFFGFQAIFFALLAIGINVHFGYTGLLNFGQIAFAMLGGFGIATECGWGRGIWISTSSSSGRMEVSKMPTNRSDS